MTKFNILVVDNDTTCLLLLKAHLEKWNYEVTTVDDTLEALCMLRIGSYDLVISDVHMPGINGIELLKQIDEEFHLPVIMISADGNAEVMCMMEGAQRFLEKPIEANDLKEIWQIIVWWKAHNDKNTAVITENNESTQGGVEDHLNGHDDNVNADGSRKKNLAWTPKLHSRFAEALLFLGYENAVPSKILEFMNVPGVTQSHVASHLQKYRIFLQEVLDGIIHIECSKWIDVKYISSTVPGNPDLLLLNQLSEKRRKENLAVDNPLLLPKQHNIDANVQFPIGSSSSGQYTPLPQYTTAEAYSSANVASRELGSATFPHGYNENFESSSTSGYIPDMGEMGYYQNTLVQQINNYLETGGLFGGGSSDMISSANNLAPSGTAPYAQQSINVGGQGSSNVSTDQLGKNHGDPSIGISFNANQFGNNSTMNEQYPQQPDGEQMTDGSWPFNNNGSSFYFN